jgi:hypothetical protein
LTCNTEVAAGATLIPVSLPVILLSALSSAVIDCVPAVTRVALKLPAPLVSVDDEGSVD